MEFHVGIVGAGPAGLTTALVLERTCPPSVRITLVDRSTGPLDYPGVEYGIQERACRALERLGITNAVLGRGHRPSELVFHNTRTQRQQLSVRVNPDYTVNVLRQEFLVRYTNLLTRTRVLRQHHVERIEKLANGRVRTVFQQNHREKPEPLDFDCLVACDGIHSVARRQFFPEVVPQDRGFSALYLLISAPTDVSCLNERVLELANGPRVQFSLGSFSVNAYFPQGGDRMTLALGFDHRVGARLWQEQGLEPRTPWAQIEPATKKAIARRLTADTPLPGSPLSRALDFVPDWNSPTVYRWMMHDSDPLPVPFASEANVVLIGDAAHAFLPTIGMGASLAIEDAERLGTALGGYLTSGLGSGWELALREQVFLPFARERRPVWEDLMWRARTAARNWIAVDRHRRFTLGPYLPGWWGSRLVAALEQVIDRAGL